MPSVVIPVLVLSKSTFDISAIAVRDLYHCWAGCCVRRYAVMRYVYRLLLRVWRSAFLLYLRRLLGLDSGGGGKKQ